jgi:hypothetical protein
LLHPELPMPKRIARLALLLGSVRKVLSQAPHSAGQ